nr:hypothetical protein [Tanacetum cinerariifolium]
MMDYTLWEVIENGVTLPKTHVVEGVTKEMPITTAEEKAQRRLEVKEISTLRIGILNEHQLKFNSIKNAKQLLEAIEKRFGRNAATKKKQRNLLKQQFENFSVLSFEMLDQTLICFKNDMEEIDLRWQMAMLTMRARRESELMVLAYKIGFKSVEEILELFKKNEFIYLENIKVLKVEIQMKDIAIGELRKKLEKAQKEKDVIQLNVDKLKNASKSLNKLIECQIVDNCKKCLGYENYNAVSPPYTRDFMPLKLDLSFTSLDKFVNKPVVKNYKARSSKKEPKVDNHYHQNQFKSQRMVKPIWNNDQRVNHHNFTKKTHYYAKENIVPREVLMKIAILINTDRQVNTTHSKTTVNATRPMTYLSKIAHSTVKRPIHKTSFKNNNVNQRVNTVRGKHVNTARPKAVVNAVKGNHVNVVKASACWVWKPKTKVLDHVSKHNSASIIQKKFDYIDAQGISILLAILNIAELMLLVILNTARTQYKATPNESSSQGTDSGGGPRCQEAMGDSIAQTRFENVSKHSNDLLLSRGNTLQSDKDRIKLNELIELCINLQTRVIDLEKKNTTQANEIDSLKRRVKKLERRNKSRTHKLKRLYKERRIDAIDADEDITLVNVQADVEMFDAEKDLGELKTSKPKAKGVVIQEPSESSTSTTTIPKQKSQDKVKGILVEEPMNPKKKDQIRLDEEAALKLEDLKDLYELVKDKYGSTRPVEDLYLLLWGDLKTMFERRVEVVVWKKQQGYKVLEWKLYDSYGIHSLRMQSMQGRIVGIKNLLDAVGITAAHVLVKTAQLELVLLVYFNEKYAK